MGLRPVKVSILVLMEGTSELRLFGARKRRGRVSILVLMEGTSELLLALLYYVRLLKVSILVLMEGTSELFFLFSTGKNSSEFQSLF